MTLISKLSEIAKINMKANLSYITAAWGAFIITLLQIFIFYYIWMAIYAGKPLINGISKEQMIGYIILTRTLYTQLTWSSIYVMGEMIYTGEIAMELLRPVDFQLAMYVGRIGDLIAFGFMTGVPAVVISGVFLGHFTPSNPIIYLYFTMSLFMAVTIGFLLEFWIGILAFYTKNSWGLQIFYEALIMLFSGALIPLIFFPGWLRFIVEILPFKDAIYTPVSIYLGLVKGSAMLEAMLFQLIWIVVLFVLSRLFYLYSIKKVTVQGG